MRAVFISYRLGGTDGVSVEVAKWQEAFRRLGWEATSVAGEGRADTVLDGLGMDSAEGPDPGALQAAVGSADLVVVDNLLSIPLNLNAATAVGQAIRGRPAVLRHHDLPWQHTRWARGEWAPPDDESWSHVVLSELSRVQMADRGIRATTIYNCFDSPGQGEREVARQRLGVAEDELLVLHPSRAIARKNVAGALALAQALGATYWLSGAAEQGYGQELARLLKKAPVRTILAPFADLDDAYAAADVVAFPSDWEGFGNPPLEASLRCRPVAVGGYPVAAELETRFGFRWFPADRPTRLRAFLDSPDAGLLEHNRRLAETHFSFEILDRCISGVLGKWGW